MILDVGCGDNPKGHVNLDLNVGRTRHLHESRSIDPKVIPNFVRGSINCLPFRNDAFDLVVCHHVLEHEGVNFSKAIRELLRVTKDKAVFVVPHRYARGSWLRYKQFESHDKYFNVTTLSKWLKKQRIPHEIRTRYRTFPSIFPILRLPWEIEVTMVKT